MPSHSLVYPFTLVGIDGKNRIYRPYLPVIITCSKTGRWQRFMGIADTGADACLIPGGVTKILGSAVNSGVKNPNGASGIGASKMPTWKHNLGIILITPDRINKAFTCPAVDIDCMEASDKPLLLGTIGFLENFKATFEYDAKRLIINFDT